MWYKCFFNFFNFWFEVVIIVYLHFEGHAGVVTYEKIESDFPPPRPDYPDDSVRFPGNIRDILKDDNIKYNLKTFASKKIRMK